MPRPARLLATVLVCAIGAAPISAQTASPADPVSYAAASPGTGSVTGTVRFADSGAPAPDVTVIVVGTTLFAVTDSLGTYRIEGAPTGAYELEARRIGAASARRVVVIRERETITANWRLGVASQELARVQVIGERTDALARIPGSAAAISGRQLLAQQPFSANEALRIIPGVHVQQEEGAGLRANIGIRGLDPDRSRSLLVLEDGVPVTLAPYGEPEMYYSPPIERMERLELLKGSGSILFGPQTIGGVLNYVTADAPLDPAGSLLVQGGTGATRLVKAGYGGTWGVARGTVGGLHKAARDLNGLELSVTDLTGKIGVRAGSNDFGLKLSIYDESSNATYVGLTDSLYRADPHMHPAENDRLRLRRYAITASHDRTLGQLTRIHTNAYAYQTTRDWQRQDYSYNATGNGFVFRNSTGNRNRAFEVAGIEPRLRTAWTLGTLGSELEVGARAHVERARDQHINGSSATSRTGAIRDDEIRTGVALSAFAQNRLFITPSWHLTPGVRLEHFAFERNILRTRVARTVNGTTTRNPEDVDIRSHDSVAEVIPGIGTAWTPNELLTVFAGAHRGFAPPRTKDALIYENPTLAPNDQVPELTSLQLDAERSWNYEGGTRLTPLSFLSLELTAFALDFSNQIIEPSLSSGSVSQATLANQGRTKHRGIEAGISVDIGKVLRAPWSVVAAASYTAVDAVFDGDRLIENAEGDTVNVSGNRLPYAPRNTAHASLTFDHPAGLLLRVDGSYVGDQYSDNFETRDGTPNGRIGLVPAHRLLDVSGQYRTPFLGGLTLIGSVKNATDAQYIASRRPEGIKVGLPRMVMLGARVDF